ncbi:MAG: arginine--tRNA ligase [Sulfolobales archaeon]|nr:arginine--tRNA ligase [Sulfolobales archaeon]MDW8082529.1 arginine--tRNA ligase [Sulfolobales archaeon]
MCEPYAELRRCIGRAIARATKSLGVSVNLEAVADMLQEPPKPEFGDLALPIPRVSKQLVENCGTLASQILEAESECIERVQCVGSYLNIWTRNMYLIERLATALSESGSKYGIPRKESSARVVVEFVSANPVHPLHIGSGRNAILGDFIARAHELSGDIVERRYYVNDLGLQVAHLLYGYIKLGRPRKPGSDKDDHFLGLLYAATSTVLDIIKAKKKLETVSEAESEEIRREIDTLLGELLRIKKKLPELVDSLLESVGSSKDVEQEVKSLTQLLELGDRSIVNVHREVVDRVLAGIRETLEKLGIHFDKWDYESDLVYSGLVDEILNKARSSNYFTLHKNAPALDLVKLANNSEVREALAIPKHLEIPPLIFARSNGTTLYTTRDIAYTIKKFSEFSADRVYNVVAIEQMLPQAQLRLALYALGYVREAVSLIHYAYEMVNVKGLSMSGRRARYITVDEVIEDLAARVRDLAEKRGVKIADDVALKIARSAFKYVMLSVSPRKTLVFDLEQAVEVKSGTATYLQYTLARANSIMSKYGREVDFSKIDCEGLIGKRRELALLIARFPEVFRKVVIELAPEDMVSYLNRLAEVFNSWYDTDPVLAEPREELRNLKLMLVYGTRVVIENSFKLLGLDIVEKI